SLLKRLQELDPAHTPRAEGVPAVASPVSADGLWGSFAPVLAGAVARELGRPLLYVTAHLDQADELRDDLELLCGLTPDLLSAFETVTGEGAASDEIHAERVALCARLMDRRTGSREGSEADRPPWIVAPIQALMQSVPSPSALAADLLDLRVGEQRDP